ncbi:MAG: glucose 1-dehydrogenase [Gammaproteobacteria bacterium]|nr:glucose 1-dehydrogenase [Gammaproteobacteria bacterium]MBI5615477.1 glucose 1-dehydrogenase [Gammaproteobacteria bacterium]
MSRLAGKTAIISGALGGQGCIAVERFLAEGAKVIASDRAAAPTGRVAELCKASSCVYVGGDVCDEAVQTAIVAAALERFGRVDVLFNNHGIILGKPFLETAASELDAVWTVNVRATYLLSQKVAREMVKTGGGSIVHNSSIGGVVAFHDMTAYGAAKAAVAHLARAMAADLVGHGIRVNAICPGAIDTQMPRNFVGDHPEREAIFQAIADKHLMKRFGRPEEPVNLALFLASDEASYITGAVIPVDGGLSAI